jgi:hypothetical protein
MTSPVHLVVLCHGLWGETKHLNTLETLLQRSFGEKATITRPSLLQKDKKAQQSGGEESGSEGDAELPTIKTETQPANDQLLRQYASEPRGSVDMDVIMLNTSSNEGGNTYDGIDWLAERVVKEIKEVQETIAQQAKYVARLSIIGYSLGGLVARCVIGLLESQRFFAKVQARQVITIATPHIGSPPGSGAFGRLVSYVGARLLSRTGEQLYAADQGWQSANETAKIGLLECMARPDSIFIRGLRRFEKVHFYANAVNDVTVPFRTGCIEEWDPFVEFGDRMDVKVLPDAPIITEIVVGQPRPKTLSSYLPTVPFFFNPRRIPLGFPYNYLVVLGSPILIPVFTVRVLVKLSGDSKKSRLRIADLERGWEIGEDGQESRIDRLVRGTLLGREAGDGDDLAEGTPSPNSSKLPWHSPWPYEADRPASEKQPDLLLAQKTMVRNLNNADIIPRLTKVWAYYPDVTNAHAIIVARTLSVEPHKRGLPVIKHIVDDFLP